MRLRSGYGGSTTINNYALNDNNGTTGLSVDTPNCLRRRALLVRYKKRKYRIDRLTVKERRNFCARSPNKWTKQIRSIPRRKNSAEKFGRILFCGTIKQDKSSEFPGCVPCITLVLAFMRIISPHWGISILVRI